jgi:hypothetical protein
MAEVHQTRSRIVPTAGLFGPTLCSRPTGTSGPLTDLYKNTWQGILGWVRPLRSVVSTRIEEVNDAGTPMTVVDLTEELDNAAASEVVVHLTWNTCTERGSWTQDGV